MRKYLVPLACLATVATISSCSDSESGSATPAAPPQGAETGKPGAAPVVQNPLDINEYLSAPCTVVTTEQLISAGITTRNQVPQPADATGPLCKWNFEQAGSGGFGGTFVTPSSKDGLGTLYNKNAQGHLELFEELPPIGTYPSGRFWASGY